MTSSVEKAVPSLNTQMTSSDEPNLDKSNEKKPILNCNEMKQRKSCLASLRSYYTLKNRVCFIGSTWGFLTAIERSIILPTLWLFFSSKFSPNAATKYYGLTLAAFNLAVLICSPIYGFLAYRNLIRVKVLLVISNQLEILGNLIYFASPTPFLVLLGRFIAGMGAASEVPFYSDVVRVTTLEERTPVIVFLLMARQFGLIIGPAFTLFLHPVKFDVTNNFQINVYNAPGLFMAALWVVHTIGILTMYPNINKSRMASTNERIEEEPMSNESSSYDALDRDVIIDKSENVETFSCSTTLKKLKNLFRPEPLTMLIATFASYFNLMALEAVVPPNCTRYFKWSEFETSVVYLISGVLVIAVCLILRWLSKKYEDRLLLIVGLGLLLVAYMWNTMVYIFINDHASTRNMYIALVNIGVLIHIFGEPIVIGVSESLYTKLIAVEDTELGQSVFRATVNLAFLIGIFAGGSLQFLPWLVFFLMLILTSVAAVSSFRNYDCLHASRF